MALKRAPVCGRNVCLFSYIAWIILIQENKKKLTETDMNTSYELKFLLTLYN